jgi:hypothetical protein
MSSSSEVTTTGNRKEVSETAYEYLLGEIINFEFPAKGNNDTDAATAHRLAMIGHNIGYR